MLRINLSFKNTTRDIKLYTVINSKEEKSDFIKSCVEYYLKSLEKNKAWTNSSLKKSNKLQYHIQ